MSRMTKQQWRERIRFQSGSLASPPHFRVKSIESTGHKRRGVRSLKQRRQVRS